MGIWLHDKIHILGCFLQTHTVMWIAVKPICIFKDFVDINVKHYFYYFTQDKWHTVTIANLFKPDIRLVGKCFKDEAGLR